MDLQRLSSACSLETQPARTAKTRQDNTELRIRNLTHRAAASVTSKVGSTDGKYLKLCQSTIVTITQGRAVSADREGRAPLSSSRLCCKWPWSGVQRPWSGFRAEFMKAGWQ